MYECHTDAEVKARAATLGAKLIALMWASGAPQGGMLLQPRIKVTNDSSCQVYE